MAKGKPELEGGPGDSQGGHPGPLSITYEIGDGQSKTERFTDSLIIGRDSACEIQLSNELVSNPPMAL